MRFSGDPVRLALIGVVGTTSVAIGIYTPGTNSTYPFSSTDFLVVDAFTVNADDFNYSVLLGAPAGQPSFPIPSSTVMAPLGVGIVNGTFADSGTEGMSGPQGVIPSIVTDNLESFVVFAGVGHVRHAPGTVKPSWMAANT
jgi:hypothetical protein